MARSSFSQKIILPWAIPPAPQGHFPGASPRPGGSRGVSGGKHDAAPIGAQKGDRILPDPAAGEIQGRHGLSFAPGGHGLNLFARVHSPRNLRKTPRAGAGIWSLGGLRRQPSESERTQGRHVLDHSPSMAGRLGTGRWE